MIDYTLEKEDNLIDGLNRLKGITELLRSENGCPWDKKQSAKNFAIYLIDETYEYIDAINNKDKENQSEELGDIINNLLMLTTIHEETGFDVVKTINDECEKIVRRHPHVFTSDAKAENSEDVLKIWDKVKTEIEGRTPNKENFFDKVPQSLPEIAKAFETQKLASKAGFDWIYKQDVIDKICEELDELIEADTAISRSQDEVEDELGDLLFAVINYSRFLKVNPAVALRRSTNKFQNRFKELKNICDARDIEITPTNVKELDKVWEEVKERQKVDFDITKNK
ncbi:MAG: nucleoside triphosphate pyrophosphohydrolase [Sphaerochaetaceae bacterium]|nr:nucleoside triphosphate pyrophosphohydrolase [Sphaerochaetaceae bacterium]